MAKVDIKMPEGFLQSISMLGSAIETVTEKVQEVRGEIVLAQAQSNLASVVGNGTKYESRSTGELESALGLSSVKMDKNGNHNIKVGFAEPRGDGISNAKLANIIEYGKHGQPAKPFMKPAKTASRTACINAMQDKFEEEVRKL